MIRVAIIGASGYTGAESVEILMRHPDAELTYLTATEDRGSMSGLFPQFEGRCDLNVEALDLNKLSEIADVALCCLPHKVSMNTVPKLLESGVKVVDFSADYRLRDVTVYEQYYKVPHIDTANLPKAAFGLPELFRDKIRSANLVANPGCYPTCTTLGLAPLLKNGLIENKGIIVNSVSGITGAGKTPSSTFHFPNMNEDYFAYGIGSHRHMPEMEQIASEVAGDDVELLFQPHVGPFDRGMLSSIYCDPKKEMTQAELLELYRNFYNSEPFVKVLETSPHVKSVAKTNYCHVYPTVVKGKIVVFSAIDNLVKGASGQAVQNMNIIFGLDEMAGLK